MEGRIASAETSRGCGTSATRVCRFLHLGRFAGVTTARRLAARLAPILAVRLTPRTVHALFNALRGSEDNLQVLLVLFGRNARVIDASKGIFEHFDLGFARSAQSRRTCLGGLLHGLQRRETDRLRQGLHVDFGIAPWRACL